jgi:carboxylesterase
MAKQPLGVLVLHGFTSSLDCVSSVEAAIRALGLPTRMPVLRGHGAASPEALRPVTWPDWVADGQAALDDLLTEVDRAILFGHSMGGLVALTLAAENGDWIDSIVTAAAPVQLANPMAPGRPFSFLIPVVRRLLKNWPMPPKYVDRAAAATDTCYRYAPIPAVTSFLEFSGATRRRLPEVLAPILIMQSHKDTTAAPESAEIIYREVSTPAAQKRIVWFDVTEHEMFRDCEREATARTVAEYVRERANAKPASG